MPQLWIVHLSGAAVKSQIYLSNNSFLCGKPRLYMRQSANQEAAFKDLFSKEYNKLCKYAFSYTQDEHTAEDVVQDTFIKIWEKKRDLIESPEIRFYLITAVRNNCITLARKKKNQKTQFTDNTPEPDPEPYFSISQETEKENRQLVQVQEALNQLPPKCKEVFLLIKLHGLSYKDAAATLDISIKTIENQMGKAIRILRDYNKSLILFIYLLADIYFVGIGVFIPFIVSYRKGL